MTPVRVLVVDDQEPYQRAVSALVESSGHFVVIGCVGTGEASVEAVARLAPDLVLMDVNLPGIDGMEATRRIGALARPPVVVLLSTYDESEYGDEAGECGAVAYVTKSAVEPDGLREIWASARG